MNINIININTDNLKLSSDLSYQASKVKDDIVKSQQNTKQIKMKKLIEDFSDIRVNTKEFNPRFVNNNIRLSNYENEMNRMQFIDQKLKEFESIYEKNSLEENTKFIEGSVYNNIKVFADFFPITDKDNIRNKIQMAKESVNTKYINLEKDFQTIEVASQNIISLTSVSSLIGDKEIKSLNKVNLENALTPNKNNILELIS